MPNRHKANRVKLPLKCLILFVLSIITVVIGIRLFKKSLFNTEDTSIYYKENNTIDYKVYLKENNFFEEPFLGKDNIYITSLIDYLDIDFNNSLLLDKPASGSYSYYIKAVASATKVDDNTKNFWEKEYNLTEVKTVDYNNTRVINFNENIKVDYQKYNDILLEFKKEYNLSLDGTLKVVLYVENKVEGKDDKKKESYSILSIPLTKATIEVPISITSDTNNVGAIISKKAILKDSTVLALRIGGGSSFTLGIGLFIWLSLIFVRLGERQSIYLKTIKKILKEYDGIIVNLNNAPGLEELNVVDVSKFSELIDAHSEVRQPINFIKGNDYSDFILINNKMAWRYRVVKE